MRIYSEYLLVKLRCRTDKIISTFDLIDGVEVEKIERFMQVVKIPLKKEDCVFSYLKVLKEDRPDCEIISFLTIEPEGEVDLSGGEDGGK